MPLSADNFFDRQFLKKRVRFWQIVSVLIAITFIITFMFRGELGTGEEYVARLEVNGLIIPESQRTKLLSRIADDENIKALMVIINSPGGSFVGGEVLFKALRKIGENKPIVVVMEDLATSAAYMTAIAGDRIFARQGSLTGSIGVIVQTADLTQLLTAIGVKAEAIKSSPLKAQPNPMEPFSDEARSALQAVVNDVHRVFIKLVAERRGLNLNETKELSDGRVFSGGQALFHGLVDAIGGEDEALQWLANVYKIPTSLSVKNITPRSNDKWWFNILHGTVGEKFFNKTLRLDGLISVWHPEIRF